MRRPLVDSESHSNTGEGLAIQMEPAELTAVQILFYFLLKGGFCSVIVFYCMFSPHAAQQGADPCWKALQENTLHLQLL